MDSINRSWSPSYLRRKAPIFETSPYLSNFKLRFAAHNYPWNEEVVSKLTASKNDKLRRVFQQINHKGQMALGVACAEWTVALFEEKTDTTDAKAILQASWAAVVNARYVRDFPPIGDGLDPVMGPLSLTLDLLSRVRQDYASLSPLLSEPLINLVSTVCYLAPDVELFEAWLSSTLIKLRAEFPMVIIYYDHRKQLYDDSYERPVPREFFDPSVEVNASVRPRQILEFLKTLDPRANLYLNDSRTMKSLGYKGYPYPILAPLD